MNVALDDQSDWPMVAIVVLNWNNYEDTSECLDSLADITYPNYKVHVVDNGSTDQSGGRLEMEYDWCEFVFTGENLGYTGGNNKGAERAMEDSPDYVLFLNNDAVVTSSFLRPLVATAESERNIGIVGPIVYDYGEEDTIQSAGGEISLWTGRHISYNQLPREDTSTVDYVSGSCLMISSDLFDELDGFDEDYFLYTDEIDLCYRANQKGYRIMVASSSKIYHKEHGSTGSQPSPLTNYFQIRNNVLFMRKHAKRHHWLTYLPVHGLRGLKRIGESVALDREPQKAKAVIHGFLWHLNKDYGDKYVGKK